MTQSNLPPWLVNKYNWKWENNRIHTPEGENVEPVFRDVRELTCDQLRDLMKALVKSNNTRARSILNNDAHVVTTFREYMLYLAARAVYSGKGCGGDPPDMKYDAPAPPRSYQVEPYITETLRELGVKVMRMQPKGRPQELVEFWLNELPEPAIKRIALPKGVPNSWRMPHVSPTLSDPFPCIRCHPWDGRSTSPVPSARPPVTVGEVLGGLGTGVFIVATGGAGGGAVVAGRIVVGKLSEAAAALLIAAGLGD
jgi:hypothetical protein